MPESARPAPDYNLSFFSLLNALKNEWQQAPNFSPCFDDWDKFENTFDAGSFCSITSTKVAKTAKHLGVSFLWYMLSDKNWLLIIALSGCSYRLLVMCTLWNALRGSAEFSIRKSAVIMHGLASKSRKRMFRLTEAPSCVGTKTIIFMSSVSHETARLKSIQV